MNAYNMVPFYVIYRGEWNIYSLTQPASDGWRTFSQKQISFGSVTDKGEVKGGLTGRFTRIILNFKKILALLENIYCWWLTSYSTIAGQHCASVSLEKPIDFQSFTMLVGHSIFGGVVLPSVDFNYHCP